jgi:hypothetical protein
MSVFVVTTCQTCGLAQGTFIEPITEDSWVTGTVETCPRCGGSGNCRVDIKVIKEAGGQGYFRSDGISAPVHAEASCSQKEEVKMGRPRILGERPWEAAGMSRSTWFRRKKKMKK